MRKEKNLQSKQAKDWNSVGWFRSALNRWIGLEFEITQRHPFCIIIKKNPSGRKIEKSIISVEEVPTPVFKNREEEKKWVKDVFFQGENVLQYAKGQYMLRADTLEYSDFINSCLCIKCKHGNGRCYIKTGYFTATKCDTRTTFCNNCKGHICDVKSSNPVIHCDDFEEL